MSTHFDAAQCESTWWSYWMEQGFFHAPVDSQKPAYTILIPPPNVTSKLHMGHGLNNTLQDILIRWKRMSGFNACWLPGTDHAGISTQMMVERALEKEGVSRHEMGRQAFVDRCKAWKEENGDMIISQLKRLGASCDWQRQAYTMDENLSQAVRTVFVKLFEDGLIYRGERLVHWDPALQTALSDDEIETEEIQGQLYALRYEVDGHPECSLVVATTRPETLFGDTAVAVNPHDERYKHLVGAKAIVPFCKRLVPIIADDYVKMDFGTGALKVTPAHDHADFELGKRHGLACITVLDDKAHLNEHCPAPFAGLERFTARKEVVKRLKELGQLVEVKPYKHAVPLSERSKVIIEPRLSLQWYVRMKDLAAPAIEACHKGSLNFLPDGFRKVYLHWMENIQDWCISRQLWWGHQIPIWHCQDCKKTTTGLQDPTQCASCHSPRLTQDEDVLDTWFSSWLWPLSPFGWPKDTPDLNTFFPSQVLITGGEIIFLWVARMVMVSYYLKGTCPFKDVYFNSIICDKNGRKFSKTLGNGIDPIEVIDRFGADAVRFTCVSLAPMGGRVKMDMADFVTGQRFVTKLWNASRYLKSALETYGPEGLQDFNLRTLTHNQAWLLHELHLCAQTVNRHLERYDFHEAVSSLYHTLWQSFCDWGVELAKIELHMDSTPEAKNQTLSVLCYVFEGLLRLAAPVMPFITEELWQSLPAHPRCPKPASLVIAPYPTEANTLSFPSQAQRFEKVKQLMTALRSVRTQSGVAAKESLGVFVACDLSLQGIFSDYTHYIKALGGVRQLDLGLEFNFSFQALIGTGPGFAVFVDVTGLMDLASEKQRLSQEAKRIEGIVSGLNAKLSNEAFTQKAPPEVIRQHTEQRHNMIQQLETLRQGLRALS